MNRNLLIAFCVMLAIAACRKEGSEMIPAKTSPSAVATNNTNPHSAAKTTDDSTVGSLFIGKGVANQMISSYIYSLGTTAANGDDLKSFSIDADSLRAYLADSRIKNIKISFAHTPAYLAAGHSGQYCGLKSGKLTLVVSGYATNGDYIYYGDNEVLDHAAPCPYTCGVGDASLDLLQ